MEPTWWQNIRIRSKTKERLERFRERIERLVYDGKIFAPVNERLERVSMDTLVSILLDREEGHQKRNREQTARRRTSKVREPEGRVADCE